MARPGRLVDRGTAARVRHTVDEVLTIQVVETIRRSADDILEFVMDAEAYQAVDAKIRPVRWMRRDGDVTEFAFASRLAGLPSPPVVSRMTLTPGERVDIALAPPPANRLTRLASDFEASFVCTPSPDGTVVTRTLVFRFRPYLRWMERVLRGRLTADVREEMRLARLHLERDDGRA